MKNLTQKHIKRISVPSTNWLGNAGKTPPVLKAAKEAFAEARITAGASPLVANAAIQHLKLRQRDATS